MEKKQKTMMVVAMAAAFIAAGIFFADLAVPGSLEPPDPPGPTMLPLNELPPTWSRILPANDGETNGCNSSRFKCVMGGAAVLDMHTGLTWARDACLGKKTLPVDAVKYCYQLTIANQRGWRIPEIFELSSLLDMSQSGTEKLPSGHPFANVVSQNTYYWSGTKGTLDGFFWVIGLDGQVSEENGEGWASCVWPVRGGK